MVRIMLGFFNRACPLALMALMLSMMLSTHAEVTHSELEIPIKVGDLDLRLVVEDGTDMDAAVQQMSEKFQEMLTQELVRKTQESTLDIPVQISGTKVNLRIMKGNDVKAKTESFCKEHSLDDEVTASLTKEVMMRAVSKGFVPLLTLPINLNEDTKLEFPVFIGQNLKASIVEFLQKHKVQPTDELVGKIEKEAQLRLVASGLQPLSQFVFKGSDGKDLPSLNIFVGDNITQNVANFVAQHQLPAESHTQIQEHIVKSMRAEGLMPISEFPVSVDGEQQLLPLFVGDTVPQAVEKFMRTHGIDPVHTDTMNARVLQRAEEEGLSPIAAYTVNVQNQPVTLPLFKGTKVSDAVGNFGKVHGLTADEVAFLHQDVQKSLQAKGLAPLVEFKFDIGGNQAVLPLFSGQNVTEMVYKFGEAHGIGSEALQDVFNEVNRVMREKGLAPVAEFTIAWEGKQLTLTVLEGEDLRQMVANFAQAHGIPQENAPEILRQVSAKMVAEGKLPAAQLPVTVGDQKLTLSFFNTQTPGQAVAKFCEQHGLDAAQMSPSLEAGLNNRLKDAGVLPLTEFTIGLGGTELKMPLFTGQKVADAVAVFVEKHSIPAAAVEGLVKEVTRRASTQGVIPFIGIPITVSGTEQVLSLYVGQDVAKEVEAFGQKHQVGAEDLSKLQTAVKQVLDDATKKTDGAGTAPTGP